MTDSPRKVLLIEDNSGDARLIQEMLREATVVFDLVRADRLAVGLKLLAEGSIALVLLDLSLPDSCGFETFLQAYARFPEVPIVVLTGLDDSELAAQSVQKGAEDYLVKGQLDGDSLLHAMRCAIERHRLQSDLRNQSFTDSLTGLYNRHGFLTLAQQQWGLATRADRELALLFLDVDNMKWINDTLGHTYGDEALIATAHALRSVARRSDLMARFGGDEFVVLIVDASEDSARMVAARLQMNLEFYNEATGNPFDLSVSVGIASSTPEHPLTIQELLSQADKSMYVDKRAKKLPCFIARHPVGIENP